MQHTGSIPKFDERQFAMILGGVNVRDCNVFMVGKWYRTYSSSIHNGVESIAGANDVDCDDE